jgi:Holliday junction resolvasome RuvABC endonuclease subunit
MILGLDLAPKKAGWCAGDGSCNPTTGGFRLPGLSDDYAMLLERLRWHVEPLLSHYDPDVVLIESPILPARRGSAIMGSLAQRRVQFAQGPFVEWLVARHAVKRGRGIICEEAEVHDVKLALSGQKWADKAEMVRCAERLGIVLPAALADGREDAADAVGVWLVGVRHHAKQHLAAWDQRIYGRRGLL